MSKILWTSHFDMKGSGYLNLSVPLCEGLVAAGHEVKVLGFEYRGEEHHFPFSVIPTLNFQDIIAQTMNIKELWKPDVFVSAFDVTVHSMLLSHPVFNGVPYVGIFPIESDPLCLPYAMLISRMQAACVISKFGTEECKKFGIDAHYLPVGMNMEEWRIPAEEERLQARETFGLSDTFAVLTVADNQERKCLSRSLEIFADFHKTNPNSKYVLVTREHLPVGWELRDYARVLGIGDSVLIFERGMSQKDLWMMYAAADMFLITPKAEGAGLPVLEAMAIGLPVAGTDCTAIHEHLSDGRGYLIPYNYQYVDPFMNGNRYFVDREAGAKTLQHIYNCWLNDEDEELDKVREAAFKYIEDRKWETSVVTLDTIIKKVGGSNVAS
jgi:glycosyltransferase involved in cell wall biosynthesis